MVLYSPHRIAYLNRLLKLIKMRGGILRTSETWPHRRLQAYDLLFLFFYGLPIGLQLSAAGNIIARYVPNYESRYPADDRPRRVIEATKRWIDEPQEAYRLLTDCWFDDATFETHVHFVSALESLIDLLLHRKDDALWLAAKTTRIIQSCIQQRLQDVWMADDPEAAYAWSRAQQIECELSPTEESTEWHEIIERVAVSRRLDIDNVACWAVERREWYILVEWLRPSAEMYPYSLRPTTRELKLWREDTWDMDE